MIPEPTIGGPGIKCKPRASGDDPLERIKVSYPFL